TSVGSTLGTRSAELEAGCRGPLYMFVLLAHRGAGGRAGEHRIVKACVVDETRPTDPCRDGQCEPAAEVGDGDVFDVEPFQLFTGSGDRILTVRVRVEAGIERSRNRKCTLPLLLGKIDVSRREGKAVGITDSLNNPDFQRQIEIRHELFNHRDLLGVLLAEE